MGTYEELLATSTSFAQLLEDIDQHKQPNETERPPPFERFTSSDTEQESDQLLQSEIAEMHEKGTVKSHVYFNYLRAGFGLVPGLTVIVVMFGMREAVVIFHNWWLAKWSEDEGHRRSSFNKCSQSNESGIQKIQSFSENEWNGQRNQNFYLFCGWFAPDLQK